MIKIFLYYFILNFIIFIFNSKVLLIFLSNFIILGVIIFLLSFNINFYSWFGLNMMFIIDYFSYILILLRIWIIFLIFIINEFKKIKFYSFLLLILIIFLILRFSSINYFLFYLFFEMSLVPTFLLIMGWGYQPERINSRLYIIFYTLFASLPLLILLFYLINFYNSLNFLFLINQLIEYKNLNYIFYFYIIFAFLVKLPIFMFHLWLPKAHVEASVSGSMILAGVILKLGGYGLYRSLMIIINYSKFFNDFFITIGLIRLILISLVTLRQFDLKILVAYSSVVHIRIMIIGLFSITQFGFKGRLVIIIAHGLCSSGLFFLVNLLYERSKSRIIYLNKGFINFLPRLTIWWFIFCVCNISAPPRLNLLSEFIIFLIFINWSINILFLLILGIFLRACYSLYLYSYSQYGRIIFTILKIYPINLKSFLNLILHFIPLNLIILKSVIIF